MNLALNNNLVTKSKREDEDNVKNLKTFKKIKKILNYIGKILSTVAIVLLLLIGAFLVYYVISANAYKKDPTKKPKINMYTIISGSMEPTIHVYDVVFDIAPSSPEEIKVGDVITFVSTSSISEGLIVTHRVQDIRVVDGNYEYITKGDYNSAADSAPASYDNIIGKVAFKIPQLGRIQFFVSSKAGWFIVVLLPALGVIIYDVIKLVKLLTIKQTSERINVTNNTKTSGDKKIDEALEIIKKKDYQENFEKLKNMHNQPENQKENLIEEIDKENNSKSLDKQNYLDRLNKLKEKNEK